MSHPSLRNKGFLLCGLESIVYHFPKLSAKWHEERGCEHEIWVLNSCPVAFGGPFGLQATPLIQFSHNLLGILGKLLKLDELLNLTPHLQNKDNNNTHLQELLWRLKWNNIKWPIKVAIYWHLLAVSILLLSRLIWRCLKTYYSF